MFFQRTEDPISAECFILVFFPCLEYLPPSLLMSLFTSFNLTQPFTRLSSLSPPRRRGLPVSPTGVLSPLPGASVRVRLDCAPDKPQIKAAPARMQSCSLSWESPAVGSQAHRVLRDPGVWRFSLTPGCGPSPRAWAAPACVCQRVVWGTVQAGQRHAAAASWRRFLEAVTFSLLSC